MNGEAFLIIATIIGLILFGIYMAWRASRKADIGQEIKTAMSAYESAANNYSAAFRAFTVAMIAAMIEEAMQKSILDMAESAQQRNKESHPQSEPNHDDEPLPYEFQEWWENFCGKQS